MLRQNTDNARSQRWQQQRHGLGLLLIMSSLLVGCLIPLTMGLFLEFAARDTLVLVFAGLAGVLLVLGIMLILASEGQILASGGALSSADAGVSAQGAAHTGPTTPLLHADMAEPGARYDERAAHPAKR